MRFLRDLWRISKSDKPALIGGVVVLIYLLVAIIGPFVIHIGYQKNEALAYLPPPRP
jgi:peptide/nickel transport system permease protein